MFDPDGEASFIAENREALRNRTVILITHRPASLALANRIIELQPGNDGTASPIARSTSGHSEG